MPPTPQQSKLSKAGERRAERFWPFAQASICIIHSTCCWLSVCVDSGTCDFGVASRLLAPLVAATHRHELTVWLVLLFSLLLLRPREAFSLHG